MLLNARATAVTSSPPCSGARAVRSPAPSRSVANWTSFNRRRVGPNTMKARSAVPTTRTPPATGAIRGPRIRNTRENGGPPGSTTTRPTGMPPTRMGANSRPRRGRRMASGPSGPGPPGRGPVPAVGSPGPGGRPRSPGSPGGGCPRGPHRRGNRLGPSDSRYSISSRTASTSAAGTSSWFESVRPSSMMMTKVWSTSPYCSRRYGSRSRLRLAASAAPTSDATSTARRRGDRAGNEPAIVSVIQRKSPASATSISARNATRPSAMRQYRLRYQDGEEPLDIGGFVPGTPDGQDHRGVSRIGFDLLAKPFDQRIDASHGDERLVLPHFAQKSFTAEDNAGVGDEHVEQLEFVERQVHVCGADSDPAARRVDLDVLVRDRPCVVPCGGACARGLAASEERADTRQQLADAKRFREVVVGAAVEAEDLVRLFAASCQHQDGRVGIGGVAADRAADGHAVEPRQHQIEDDQIESLRPRLRETGFTIDGFLRGEALETQVQRHELADIRFIFDDEDGWSIWHSFSLSPRNGTAVICK